MKTKFTSLVTVKKNSMQKSERVVQNANATLNSAHTALELSRKSLQSIEAPTNGSMQEFLASRTLLDFTRANIQHNQKWLEFAQNQLRAAKEQLKFDMIEYEKFKYLDLEEIKKIIKKQKIQEAKELDEVALMTHTRKHNQKKAS
jgi:flagellar biosynthesis chaperone FliJ